LVWSSTTFFFHQQNIHRQYKEYYGVSDENVPTDGEGEKDTPKMAPKEATARFYFAATIELTNNDITKIKEIDKLPIYLCLNMLARNKDIREAERREIEKIKKQTPKLR
jgi:hypothetical protein